MPPSILFRSATVITGEQGAAPFVADILVEDGHIAAIGSDLNAAHARLIDAKGQILSPGFFDMHAHSDLYLLTNPTHESKISQGCTTEVVGQDGISYYPTRNKQQLDAIRQQIAGWNGNPSDEECETTHAGIGMFEWTSIGTYLDCLERNRTATNVAVLVPQGNLRLLSCGPEMTVATPEQIQDQAELLRVAMREGAVGMSSGLTYTPGMYASTSELAVLCQILADEFPGAYYAPHHRSYGLKALESYDEMIGLSRSTGCPLHLTHATLNFPENAGRAPELLSRIKAAREDRCEITLDTYPYLPGCTTLGSLIPSWASSGGPSATLERLEDPATCERMRVAIEDEGCDGGHGLPMNWACVEVCATVHPDLRTYPGRTIGQISDDERRPPIEVFYDILRKDKLATTCLQHIGNEENVRQIMMDEHHTSGSDGILHGKQIHPRTHGTFPRYLGHYARDLGLETIPKMIEHLTSRPAKRVGVYPYRGLIAVGSAADLVLFDPETIMDMATYEEPRKLAVGLSFVLVNGHIAMDEGVCTGARGGKAVRRPRG